VIGSLRCDCGTQLRTALEMIATEGRGVLIYMLDHEGRGIGLQRKLQAYHLQEYGLDTVDANLYLGLPADARDYSQVPAVLTDLGVVSIRLLTNNPDKLAGIVAAGVTVSAQIRLPVAVTADNVGYLTTKRDRMGHTLGKLPPDRRATSAHNNAPQQEE
jgi:3,4-dihydroxy 2-butanone 4-phosphate synthase/GTP cyclohydrolase II